MIKQLIELLCLCLLISGCMSTGPRDNADFEQIKTLHDLEGVYANRGEGDSSIGAVYLSSIIWKSSEMLDHELIKEIDVKVEREREKKIIIRAIGKNGIIKEDEFIEGDDFEFAGGRLKLKRSTVLSLAYPSGNPFIGVGHGETDLGIDEDGHGKYRQQTTFAGTAFIVIPVSGSVTDDIRFVKIKE